MNRSINTFAVALFAFATMLTTYPSAEASDLEQGFQNPPNAAKPWVFWFWMNGNISREGITQDLESMKRVGIGGMLWMEVSGPWWAPQGPIEPGSKRWHEAMQWAISEADRLGMAFALSVDFGHGSPTGRYAFTTARHYEKKSPLMPSGLLGPVVLQATE